MFSGAKRIFVQCRTRPFFWLYEFEWENENVSMVQLNAKEKKCIRQLENRLKSLTQDNNTPPENDSSWHKTERGALLWVLEVLQHAIATNCDEAFAYTRLRQKENEQEKITKESLEHCMERTKQQKAEKAKVIAARKAATAAREAAPKGKVQR